MPERVKRRTHAERSSEMKNLLIQATLKSLQQYGYHGTSLSRILENAGVSKGAWSHHYKSKKEMIAAAVDYQLTRAIQEGRDMIPTLKNRPREDHLTVVIDYFWEHFEQGLRRDVWIEAYIAGRTDPELHDLLVPILNRFQESLNRVWSELFESPKKTTSIETLMNLTLFLTRGMAIQSLFFDDPEYYNLFKEQWVELMKPLVRVKIKGPASQAPSGEGGAVHNA